VRLAKTLVEHREYLDKIVGLKLHFLHRWLSAHPKEGFVEALRNRVDIYRKTDANPGPAVPDSIDWSAPAWRTLEEGLAALYERSGTDTDRFESAGLGFLKATLDARAPRDFADPTLLAPYDCGSLRHEPKQERPGVVGFHIANALAPASLFDDPAYLPACFIVLIDQVEFRLGGVALTTDTWLNDAPRWQALFPQEWAHNLSERATDVAWHYGFWGQFITARGTFHEEAGRYLRIQGRFRYYPRTSWAPLEVLRNHFREVLAR